jgi:hypothetical protein
MAAQGQKTGGSTRQAQHDAVAVVDEDVAIRAVCRGNDVKLPPIEGMGRIGYFQRVIWVVEGGINTGYRSTAFRMGS